MSLVISRRINEIVCVGSDVEIEIVGIFRGQVKLAIRAPKEISVDRLEVRLRKNAGELPPDKTS